MSGLYCILSNTTCATHNPARNSPFSAQFAGFLAHSTAALWQPVSGRLGGCWWGLEGFLAGCSCTHPPVPCSVLSLTAKLLNWQSADQWLLEKCISGSQGMWRFRAFVRGMAGGHGVLRSPFSASRGPAAQQDTGTELRAWVSTCGTEDTATQMWLWKMSQQQSLNVGAACWGDA